MILSNSKILEALENGRLVIDPEPRPKRPEDDPSVDCPYQTSAVDLRLGNEVSWFKEGLAINVDLRRGKFSHLFGPNSERRTIANDQPYVLYPGKFVLAKTLEEIKLPIIEGGAPCIEGGAPCLAARVEGRSSFARCGLLVHFTAPTIHSGFEGTITLELVNLGPLPINLFPGMYICQLIVEEVDGVPYPNESQFQGQTMAGGEQGET